jgi:hypothetical protein
MVMDFDRMPSDSSTRHISERMSCIESIGGVGK